MSDGMNHVRAMRLAEIVQEFRNLQHYITQFNANPPPDEYYTEGYALLRQCMVEAQAILQAPFDAQNPAPGGDPEREKAQLQQVILDAFARRFQAQRVYLRASAAMRWIQSRNAVLQGRPASSQHAQGLAQCDNALRAELSAITDDYVVNSMRSQDYQQGRWINEDPNLDSIKRWLRTH